MKLNKNHIILLVAGLSITSCKVAEVYKSPEVRTDNIYRQDNPQNDSVSLASLSWKELFTDTYLQNLIQKGLENNVDMKNSILTILQSQASLKQAKLSFYPTLEGTAQVSHSKTSLRSLNMGGISNQINLKTTSYQVGMSASWEADIWGKIGSLKRQALANYLESEAAQRAVQTQLISNIANNYYLLLSLDKQLFITEKTIENRKKDVETMKALKESAVVTGAAVVQSQANQYSAEVSIPDLKKQIRETENMLSVLIGDIPGEIERSTLDSQNVTATISTGLSTDLLRNRPDIQQAELNFRSAFEDVNVSKASFYPSLTLTAQGGVSTLHLKDFFSNSIFYSLIGGLTQPIFSQGKNKMNLTISKAKKEAALNTFQQTFLNAGQEVSDALYSYNTALEKQNIRKNQLIYLNKSVDFTKELLSYTSDVNYTDVLTSEQSLLSAELSSIDDKVQELQAVVNLYVALGGGIK